MDLMAIIGQLAPKIEENSQVHAMWIKGSYATGKNNSQSDIDVWVDGVVGSFDLCLAAFRLKLQEMVEVEKEISRGIYSDSPKLMKQTFILKGFPNAPSSRMNIRKIKDLRGRSASWSTNSRHQQRPTSFRLTPVSDPRQAVLQTAIYEKKRESYS